VWDLHYAPPDSLDHDYPISAIAHDTPRAPQGARALPGSYTVRLTAGGKSWTQPLTLKMDLRIKAAPEELAQQFAVEQDAVRAMNETFAMLQKVKTLRAQLVERSHQPSSGAVAGPITALDKKLETLGGAARQPFFGLPPAGKEKENLSTLNQHFHGLLRTVDSCDCAPTAQATAVSRDLQASRTALEWLWKAFEGRDVPELNRQLEKAGLAPVTMKAASNSDKHEDEQQEED
jgi:hypothetical protein